MQGFANHVGLFSECIGLRGEMLGNYPHALTHVAAVRSILQLDQALKNPLETQLKNSLTEMENPGTQPHS